MGKQKQEIQQIQELRDKVFKLKEDYWIPSTLTGKTHTKVYYHEFYNYEDKKIWLSPQKRQNYS
jgi:hypothetical protein